MRIQFSQPKYRNTGLAEQIHDLLFAVITPKYRQGLLVKILFYTGLNRKADWNGNYRNIWRHGFYDNEWKMKSIDSIITLKVGFEVPADKLLYLIAHETGHHILGRQDKRGGEKRADKLAEKLINR